MDLLEQCYASGKSEFVAIYGRRRVGKTFIVKKLFADRITFSCTGIYKGTKTEQLGNFADSLSDAAGMRLELPKDWFEAFGMLKSYLESLKPAKRKLIFFDELPWFDTGRSKFVKALEWFWNSWGSNRDDLMLVCCGSATSWMHDKLIYSKGGLHNRMTRRILLSPFTLNETEAYLKSKNIKWNRYEIAECYMIMGGIPYYLELLQPSLSLSQNIDQVMFAVDAQLKNEYAMLYDSLFEKPAKYTAVVEALFASPEGLSRNALIDKLGMSDGGSYSKILSDLEISGIITSYPAFGKRKKDVVYRLTDFFTIFYLKFMKGMRSGDRHMWTHMLDNPRKRNWAGHTFELLCLQHSEQIKLGVYAILTEMSAWRSSEKDKSLQIDLVIDRRDQVINLCEMKYSLNEFAINKAYDQVLRDKLSAFREETKTRKALHLTFVTTYGVKQNMYSSLVSSQVVLDDLYVQ